MQKILIKLPLYLLLSFPFVAYADVLTHTVGIRSAFGLTDLAAGVEDLDQLNDPSVAHFTIAYSRRLNENWAIETGFSKGDSRNIDVVWEQQFTDSRLKYKGIPVALKLVAPFARRNNFVLAVGGHRYSYDVIDDEQVIMDDDGYDIMGNVGWNCLIGNGIGLEAAYWHQRMGSNVTLRGIQAGISYSF